MSRRQQNQRNSVKLHIEELVLHGFSSQDRQRIARAIEQELSRLLSRDGVPPSLAQGGMIPQLDGGSFQVKQGASPEDAGVNVAQNIYGGLKR